MTKRYTILVRESGADFETELLQIDRNPELVARALTQKKFGAWRKQLPRYVGIRIRDNTEPVNEAAPTTEQFSSALFE